MRVIIEPQSRPRRDYLLVAVVFLAPLVLVALLAVPAWLS